MALGRDDLILSQYSLRDVGFDERVGAAADAGFAGIGLGALEYLRLVDEGWSDRDLLACTAGHGLVVDEIEALRLDGSRKHEDVMWRMADVFGASHVHVLGSYSGGVDDAVEEFGRICDAAAAHGLRAAIEFFPPTNVPDIPTAMEIIEGAARIGAGLCIDTWHHFRGACDWDVLDRVPSDRVVSIQINDGPSEAEVEGYLEDTLQRRRIPGEGAFDLTQFVRTLDANGVTVPYSVEVISTVPAHADPGELTRLMAERTRAVLADARNRAPQ